MRRAAEGELPEARLPFPAGPRRTGSPSLKYVGMPDIDRGQVFSEVFDRSVEWPPPVPEPPFEPDGHPHVHWDPVLVQNMRWVRENDP
jgi:hypothetical protein